MENKTKYEIEALSDEPKTIGQNGIEKSVGEKAPAEKPDESALPGQSVEFTASALSENRETIAPNFDKKDYRKEILIASLMAALCIGGAIVAALVVSYRFVGIIITVLAALAAYAMVNHILLSEKVLKAIGDADKVYIDELMVKVKRRKKPEFVREIGSLIKEGHLTGYAVMNDVFLEKRERK